MLVGTAVLMYTFPVFKLPELTGIFKVGTQTFHFVDTNREEIFDKAREGKRELMVQVWYPTQAGSGKRTAFIPDTRILSYMAANYGLPGFTFQHLKYVSSHAYSEAEISTAKTSYPLILGNPGNGSSRFLHVASRISRESRIYRGNDRPHLQHICNRVSGRSNHDQHNQRLILAWPWLSDGKRKSRQVRESFNRRCGVCAGPIRTYPIGADSKSSKRLDWSRPCRGVRSFYRWSNGLWRLRSANRGWHRPRWRALSFAWKERDCKNRFYSSTRKAILKN